MTGLPSTVLVTMVTLGLGLSVVESALPDFSDDHYTEDIWGDSILSEFVDDVRYDNEDKPRQCRIDLCSGESTSDPRKGDFSWPDAQLETRMYVRCPYSVVTPVYAHRDCILAPDQFNDTLRAGINNSLSDWDPPNIDRCPDPPLAELLNKLQAEERTYAPDGPPSSWYGPAIDEVYSTLTTYSEAPVFPEDVLSLAAWISRAVLVTVPEATSLPRPSVQQAVRVIDWLFTIDTERNLIKGRATWQNERLLEALVLLAEMWTPPEGELHTTLSTNYIHVVARRMTGETGYTEYFALGNPSDRLQSAVSVLLQEPGREDTILHMMYIGHPYWFKPGVYREVLYVVESPLVPVQETVHVDNASVEVTVFHRAPPQIVTEQVPEPRHIIISSVVYASVSRDHQFRAGQFRLWSANNTPATIEVSSFYSTRAYLNSPPECGLLSVYDDFQGSIENFNASKWFLQSRESQHMGKRATCEYNTFGLYTVFAAATLSDGHVIRPTLPPQPVPPKGGSSFSEFLGFPYNAELFIAGEVLRAISLVCLLVTVISYGVFQKARHGIPTQILLNLCVSLILLNVVLYVAESIGHSRWGCRVANVLRYYLVMVSLAWNVTEAVNLYLMLVRVFKSYISHFVLKAGCLAWGVPLLPVIVILAVDHRGFDGIYLQDCSLQCVLKKHVFYYAYLIPVGAMVLVNIIVFSLVVNVLRSHGSARPGENKRSVLTQFFGALSMMFLLGIPWVFSAFGVINITGNNTGISMLTGIFQVITIVFLNLQGTFIFLFHCVRNSDMRKQWKATFCARRHKLQSTSGSVPLKPSGTGSTSNTDTKYKTQNCMISDTASSVKSVEGQGSGVEAKSIEVDLTGGQGSSVEAKSIEVDVNGETNTSL